MLSGTPPVLGLVAAATGIDLVAEAGIGAIRQKSIALTDYAIALADALLDDMTVGSPRDPSRRGSHVALVHPRAPQLTERLAALGVIVDFREPDVIRLGLSPLTTRFVDVHGALETLSGLLDSGATDAERCTPDTARTDACLRFR
jgi:kynureninase